MVRSKLVVFLLIISLLVSQLSYLFVPLVYAASSPWTQTDWSGGSGQTAWSDTTKFDSSSNVTTSTAGQVTLTATSSWYNTSWAFRRKITFDNSAQAENLTNFPVQVKLTSSNIDYSNTQNSGQDIRFTDSDGTTLLSYEIETWDESGSSFVWVKVPQIDASSNTDHIYMYYGNSSAADAQAATSVWDSNYASVWHLKESGNGTAGEYKDSTSNANNGRGGNGTSTHVPALTASGEINGAQTFDGTDDYVLVSDPANGSLDFGTGSFTISAWVKSSNATAGTKLILAKDIGGGHYFLAMASGNLRGEVRDSDATNWVAADPASMSIADDVWHFITAVKTATTLTFYVDGVSKSGHTEDVAGSTPGMGNTSNATSFTMGSSATPHLFYPGSIDEIRISNTNRSAVYIAAQYKSEADTFNTFASEEPQVQASGSLTSSIFDTESSSGAAWGTLTYNATTPSNTSVTVKARTSNSSSMTGATAFSSCDAVTSGNDISSNNCVTDSHRYIQYQLALANTDSASTPTFQDISTTFAVYDADAPSISLTALSPDPNNDNTPTLSGTATDTLGTVSNVQFQMDATSGSWTACSATDGSFNSASEAFSCTAAALSDGSHTMYVRATDSNSNTTSNASATTDTFTIDVTAPVTIDLDSPANNTYTNNERPTFKWKATTDATSGLSKYKLEISNDANGLYLTVDNIATSGTADVTNNRYVVHFDGFSDSDTTNNYISVYTKSTSDWGSSSNDGKLREGKNTWKIIAFDNAGNTTSSSRIIYPDYTNPTLSSVALASSDTVGSKDGYVITTTIKPSISGTIADNLSPDKILISFYKQNFFLGISNSESLLLSTSNSLNNTNNTASLSFSFAPSQDIDYGKYRVTVTGVDKAGNQSLIQTLSIQIMTDTQAKTLLTQTDKEKEAQKNTSTISLPELEKKALLRREKEASEFEKFLAGINSMANTIIGYFESSTSYLANGTKTLANNVLEGIDNALISMIQTIASASSNITTALANAIFNTYQSTIASILPRMIDDGIENGAKIIGFVFGSISRFVGESNELALSILNNSQQNVINQISNTQIIPNTTFPILARLTNILNNSELTVKQHIASINKDSSRILFQAGEGIRIALRSFERPVNDSAAFLDRIKVGILTFQSIVFDSQPTVITNVTIEEIGQDFAVVSWKTNHYAWGKVNYGKDLTYGREALLLKREKTHTARLTGLKPGERYFFEVMSQNKNYAYDAYYSFETKK